MDNIEFDESQVGQYHEETPKLLEGVIKYSGGLIDSEDKAKYLLLFLVFSIIIISFTLFFTSSPNIEPPADYLVNQAGSPSEIDF